VSGPFAGGSPGHARDGIRPQSPGSKIRMQGFRTFWLCSSRSRKEAMDLEKAQKFKWRVEVFVESSNRWTPRTDLLEFAVAVRQMSNLVAMYPAVNTRLVSDDDYTPTTVFTQAEIDAAKNMTIRWKPKPVE
jgi:hypothetical protein